MIISNVQEINNVTQVTSDIEILNLVEAELKEPSKIVLDMNTVNTTYKNILLENGLDNKFIKEISERFNRGKHPSSKIRKIVSTK